MITSHSFLTIPQSPLSLQHSSSSHRCLSPLFHLPYYGSFSSSPRILSNYLPLILTFFFPQTLFIQKSKRRKKGNYNLSSFQTLGSSAVLSSVFSDLLFLSTLTQQLLLQISLPVLRAPSSDWIHQGCKGGLHLCTPHNVGAK